MKAKYVSVRMEKLKLYHLEGTENHNQRKGDYKEKSKTKIHHDLTKNNVCLHGEGRDIKEYIETRLKETGVKVTPKGKNASTVGVEIVISATPTHFRENEHDSGVYDKAKTMEWAKRQIKYLKKKYGDNFVRADLHLDEKTPHIHAILTPIRTKTRNKRRTKAQIAANAPSETYQQTILDCKNMFNRDALIELQDEFAEIVKDLGIQRGVIKSGADHKTTEKYWKELGEAVKLAGTAVKGIKVPSVRLSDKPLTTPFSKYRELEETRLSGSIRKAFEQLYKQTKRYALAALHYRSELERERQRTAIYVKAMGSSKSIHEYIQETKTQIDMLEGQIENDKSDLGFLIDQIDEKDYQIDLLKGGAEHDAQRIYDLEKQVENLSKDLYKATHRHTESTLNM